MRDEIDLKIYGEQGLLMEPSPTPQQIPEISAGGHLIKLAHWAKVHP